MNTMSFFTFSRLNKIVLFCGLGFSAFAQIRKVPIPDYPPLTSPNPPKIIVPRKGDPRLGDTTTTNKALSAFSAGSFSGNVATPSPEISQANYLQDIAVNKYTGTPNISIPIYSLQEGKLGVSLALSYNASGIRGNQLSGWTGLGWDLVGIPMLTRMVRGKPDEGKFEMTSWTGKVARKGYYTGGKYSSSNDDDKEPDYFFLNLGGAVYKFMLTRAYGSFKFFNDNDIQVSYGTAPVDGNSDVVEFTNFSFIMPDGSKYEFSNQNIEKTAEVEVGFAQSNQVYPFPYNVNSPNFSHYLKTNSVVSAWYCTKIVAPKGQEINLEYNDVLYSYYKLADNETTGNCPTSIDKKINRVFVQGASIDRIIGSHTIIKFNDGYNFCFSIPNPEKGITQEYCSLIGIDNRQDIEDWTQAPQNGSSAKLLKNIVVFDNDHPSEKMTWTFNYDYFTGTLNNGGFDLPTGYSYQNNQPNPVGTTHNKRLKLTDIQFPDGNTSSFSYSNPNYPYYFRTRFAYGIDHWGYVNGKDANFNLLGLIGADYLSSCGGDKETDFNYAINGSLQKITHSAGSEINFEFEANRAKNYNNGTTDVGGLRIKKIRVKDVLQNIETIKEYSYTNASGQSSGFMFVKPVYRFDDSNGFRYANSALYDLFLAESGRPVVGYAQVSETVYDANNSNQIGKTISYFDQTEIEMNHQANTEICTYDEYGIPQCTPTIAYLPEFFTPQFDAKGGSLIKEEMYNQANQKLSETLASYQEIIADSIYSGRFSRLNGTQQFHDYYLKLKKYRAKENSSSAYSEDGTGSPQAQTTTFTYKDEMPLAYRNTYKGVHNQIVKTVSSFNGNTIEQLAKYVADFNFDVDSTATCMTDCPHPAVPCPTSCKEWSITTHVPSVGTEARAVYDMLYFYGGYPIEMVSKRNGKVIGASYTTYQNFLPKLSFGLRVIPKTSFSEVFFRKTDDVMVKDVDYGTAQSEVLSYNLYGLPTAIEVKRGAKTAIAYDVTSNLLPISKTQNDGINDALVTTYQYYKSHQGASKITTPNGLEQNFEYRVDDGRLDKVKDKNGNTLKKYNYQVKPN